LSYRRYLTRFDWVGKALSALCGDSTSSYHAASKMERGEGAKRDAGPLGLYSL